MSDGIDQITELLDGSVQYDAVHIVSHGSDGQLQLGNSQVTAENIFEYQQQLTTWSSGLNANADILLYGCEVAETATGENFVATFSQLVGADIAASDDLTGNAALGGDWDLEYRFGEVDSVVAFSAQARSNWFSILASTSFQDGDGNGYNSTVDTFINEDTASQGDDNSGNFDLQVDMNDGAGDETTQTLIRFDNIFGSGTGQIPDNVYITSATLTVNVNNVSDAGATVAMHEMLESWVDTDNWSTTGGILLDGNEANADVPTRFFQSANLRVGHFHRS